MEEKKSWRIEVGLIPDGCTPSDHDGTAFEVRFFEGTEKEANDKADELKYHWSQRFLIYDCSTGHLSVQSSLIPIK